MGNSKDKRTPSRRPYAKRSLGQNFLIDAGYVSKIVSALALTESDDVIEIGPGRGALTGRVLETGARVTAVEIDTDLAAHLEREFGDEPRFRLVIGDFLEFDLRDFVPGPPAKVAANLPYYISTPILRRLFEHRELFSGLVVMLQKEVAERITAAPGDSSRGFLTVLIERGFTAEILFDVPAGAFRPVPKVESAVVRFVTKKDESGPGTDRQFEELASAAFGQKRKTLKNNLDAARGDLGRQIERLGGSEAVIRNAAIDPGTRAEALSIEEWRSLSGILFRED
ncbi:MAG TPA: 16S rRNA (adenine(1518)-N(6)/adenine(1519)-N(6))-dimethyltransferase RsmA [Aridibacter sp.]|nr:16S rRNA (adenine(1518)-N(6)/adenine(1519)-N(6))-dimethyltransferase RsmA [Aridibacter sp.]